jgi:transposase-like protein
MPGATVQRVLASMVADQGGVRRLLERIADGETITDIARELGVSRAYLSSWLARRAGRDAVDRAHREAAGAYADQIQRLAGTTTEDNSRGRRVQIDALRWLASKKDPQAYGDQQGPVVQLNVNSLHLDALRQVEARILQVGDGGGGGGGA